MKKKILIYFIVGLFILPIVVFAAPDVPLGAIPKINSVPKSEVSAGTSTRLGVKGAIARCPIIESKIQIKIGSFDNNKIKHVAVYNNLKNQLTQIIDRLVTKGIDVTDLKLTLQALDAKIKKFNDDYAVYVSKLKESQVFVCGKAQGQFVVKLKETKTALQQVQKDVVDIRSYYVSAVKPEIMRIKAALKTKATSTPEVTTSSDTIVPATSELPVQ
jgi:hypothetical protein